LPTTEELGVLYITTVDVLQRSKNSAGAVRVEEMKGLK
jgi:hypothetical protein